MQTHPLPVAVIPRKSPPEITAVVHSSPTRIPVRSGETVTIEDSAAVDLGEFIRRHYRIILAAALLGLLAAYAVAKSQSSMFRATATIEVQDLNENFLNLKEVSTLSAAPQSPSTNDLQTQLRILQSGSLIERVLNQLPKEKAQPLEGLRALWFRLRGSRPAPMVTRDEIIENAARNLGVKESRQARIVDLTYDSEDPQYAAAFVNRLAQQYIDQSIECRLEISPRTPPALRRQLLDLRAHLDPSQK